MRTLKPMIAAVVLTAAVLGAVAPATAQTPPPFVDECINGLDDDGDGLVDIDDPACILETSEAADPMECEDGVDNDGDGTIDDDDLGCETDDDEALERTPTLTAAYAVEVLKVALRRRFGQSFRHCGGRGRVPLPPDVAPSLRVPARVVPGRRGVVRASADLAHSGRRGGHVELRVAHTAARRVLLPREPTAPPRMLARLLGPVERHCRGQHAE